MNTYRLSSTSGRFTQFDHITVLNSDEVALVWAKRYVTQRAEPARLERGGTLLAEYEVQYLPSGNKVIEHIGGRKWQPPAHTERRMIFRGRKP